MKNRHPFQITFMLDRKRDSNLWSYLNSIEESKPKAELIRELIEESEGYQQWKQQKTQ